jgi:hypothetical protein
MFFFLIKQMMHHQIIKILIATSDLQVRVKFLEPKIHFLNPFFFNLKILKITSLNIFSTSKYPLNSYTRTTWVNLTNSYTMLTSYKEKINKKNYKVKFSIISILKDEIYFWKKIIKKFKKKRKEKEKESKTLWIVIVQWVLGE